MRRVEAGERFVVTRRGVPVADLVPHEPIKPGPERTLGAVQAGLRTARPIDRRAWHAQRRADDEIFGPDDPMTDEWSRHPRRDRPADR
ncbi:MAG: type II toxin-antitoxin system Phd/YefM family antitoxin [Jiangellaceae bacterium]